MKIQIVQSEIEEAVRDFIQKKIAVREDQEISMDFTATRGEDGLIANIDISTIKTPEPEADKPARAPRAPRQAAQVNISEEVPAPAPEAAAVAEPVEAGPAPVNTIGDPEPDGVEEVEGAAPLNKPSIFSSLRRPASDGAEAVN